MLPVFLDLPFNSLIYIKKKIKKIRVKNGKENCIILKKWFNFIDIF